MGRENRSDWNYFKRWKIWRCICTYRASLNELLVLANMESYNAILISKAMEQKERMIELRRLARTQLLSLEKINDSGIKRLEAKEK